MVIHRNIKLWSVRKSNLYLILLCGLLSYQQLEAMEGPVRPPKPVKSGKENVDPHQQEAKAGDNGSAKSYEQQGKMDRMRREAAQQDNATSNLNGSVESDQQSSQASPVVKGFSKRTAEAIATKFIKGLNSLDNATGLPSLCNRMIAKPLMDAWVKARNLDVQQDGNVARNEDGSLSFADAAPTKYLADMGPDERGLMNQKIDIIVNSVVKMYNDGLSSADIGAFVKSSVQLVLAAPVIGMGAGAGGVIGAAGGLVTGAGKGVAYLFSDSTTSTAPRHYDSGLGYHGSSGFSQGYMLGSMSGGGGGGGSIPGELVMILAAPIVAAAFVGTVVVGGAAAVGGAHGAVKAAPGGIRSGARYTSKALQSPSAAAKMMWNDAWKAPDSAKTLQASTANSNASQAGQPAA